MGGFIQDVVVRWGVVQDGVVHDRVVQDEVCSRTPPCFEGSQSLIWNTYLFLRLSESVTISLIS